MPDATPNAPQPWHDYLSAAKHARQTANRWRTRRVLPDAALDFAGNDYLGLALEPRVREAAADGARRFGAGATASHLVSGHLSVHETLEQKLAEWLGRERALVFSTGYMANLGVIQALADRSTALFQDRLNHASLLDGAALAGARSRRFHHRDTADLERLLARSEAALKLVISDGVFSMDGDVADVTELAAVARRHEGLLMIDDAHGIGVLGDTGGGCTEGTSPTEVPLLVGTFGKALGTGGAFVAGDASLIDHIAQFARSYVYTTAQPPAVTAATLEALKIVRDEPERRARLADNIALFRREAASLDLPLSDATTPIQPLTLGDEARTLRWAARLDACGVAVGAIRPPTVPDGQARLRITLSARHARADIERLLEGLARCRQEDTPCATA
ncbi:8-amino-7-oxononanoate synthase [Halomonas piscis]|uniref:8-amino-7-oxononanoate synthase n=1 Tax=Halomonas piscis TaxID=3031727 RepID=UPI0035E053E7